MNEKNDDIAHPDIVSIPLQTSDYWPNSIIRHRQVPPLIGWAAARGRLDPEAWILYAMVFLWQFPHFMAIAWMYRDDYARAGYLVLPTGGSKDRVVIWLIWQSFVISLALIPMGFLPSGSGGFAPG
jgi:protoheme IX farnesyltransferase